MRRRTPWLVTFVFLLIGPILHAQGLDEEEPDLTIDSAVRTTVIEAAIKEMNEGYVFPETAAKMEKAIRQRIGNKEYDGITSARQFARKLTEDLQAVSKDKHLRVFYSHEPVAIRASEDEPSPEEEQKFLSFLSRINFGFEKVERMEGNVGYLDLRGFAPARHGADTAIAAMNFLANSDALVIDLRQNGGGNPAMVALITSYLFDKEPVHLNSLYWRRGDSTHQWWTLPYVPGKLYGKDKPVFLLTSKRTFSAAEEFTYNLQNLKRVTIFGETTGGGAHPGESRRLHDHFEMFVPTGRAINPISGKNWEGTGVKPDVEMPAEEALKAAHLKAVEMLREKAIDPERKQQLSKLIERLSK